MRNGILCAETEMLDCVAYEEEIGGDGGSAGVEGLPLEEQDGDREMAGICG